MSREYFNAYHSYLKSMEPLNDTERGRLFTALLEYSSTGAEPELRGNERFIFPTIREQIDRDMKKYKAKCERNRENVLQRYTNVDERIRDDTKSTKEKEKTKTKEKTKDIKTALSEETPDGEKPSPKFPEESQEMQLSSMLFDLMRKNNPDCKEPNLQGWCKHIDLMIRRDNRTFDQIKAVIEFSQVDSFWQSNILSTDKLRKQFDQLTAKMKKPSGGKSNALSSESSYDIAEMEKLIMEGPIL